MIGRAEATEAGCEDMVGCWLQPPRLFFAVLSHLLAAHAPGSQDRYHVPPDPDLTAT